ncbi:MAG: hypothetical protein IT288_05370 [Bdellovibrionales bacterium]|nr:hypothetical protein [Bdellovibrionales bacterium]
MMHLEMVQRIVDGARCPSCQHHHTLFANIKCDRDCDGLEYTITCQQCAFRMVCEVEAIRGKSNVWAQVSCDDHSPICHLALDPTLYAVHLEGRKKAAA